MWTLFLWLSMTISDLLLWTRYWNAVLSKMKGNVLTELNCCEFLKISHSWGELSLTPLVLYIISYLMRYNPISSRNDMVLLEKSKEIIHLLEGEVDGKVILQWVIKFEREELKWFGVTQDGENWIGFVNPVINNLVPQHEGRRIFFTTEKVGFLSNLLYITQFINTHIDPVCPDRLTLRYCSCNTYLLHRRAELKAAPGSTWLMRNWTLCNNQPLAVSSYISEVISDA